MHTLCRSLFMMVLMVHFSARLGAQCNPTFNYQTTDSVYYSFAANQQQVSGYTYFHSWSYLGAVLSTLPSFEYRLNPGQQTICHISAILT